MEGAEEAVIEPGRMLVHSLEEKTALPNIRRLKKRAGAGFGRRRCSSPAAHEVIGFDIRKLRPLDLGVFPVKKALGPEKVQ